MMLVKTYVGPSTIHGAGLFASEPIPAGTKVWECNPIIDIPITRIEIDQLPEPARGIAIARSFIDYDGVMILSRDNAVFFNHSDTPNTIATNEGNFALRDIDSDEELTESYHSFGDGGCKEFLSTLTSPQRDAP